ncbi:DUF732 domain-containing protein [Mycolicibacter heraklionensis]|uniref:DUF732 domain-containing protein n=1 Tax=Mycolicibacter heraklionensis TaxID=512402 RepID=A0A9X7WLX4_9MYCO|nr:DUF732 domain-containing protein [Mycolicibacter heraklionensis]QZA09764.1 DUF732 domain-containing protein [Mycolicibacter heraklionensis]
MTASTKETAMSRITKTLSAGMSVAALLIVGTAGEAHADDASFISTIRGNGIRVAAMNDSTIIALGHIMCSSLRDGSSLDTVAGFPAGILVDGHGIAVTAQQELCPDTIK